ncbi:unnamed protein product [Diamesa hyperborea]
MIDQKMNGSSSLESTSNNKTKQPVKNSDNIYDIICYYDDNNDEESVGNVNDVINKIEKANSGKRNNNTSRYSDKIYLHWKLFGCLIINVLLSSPIYAYGTIYLNQKEMFDASPALIWPPILYNSVYLIVTPWLFNTISTPSTHTATSNTSHMSLLTKLTNKNIIILFTLMLSMGISICGVLFTFFKANFFLILIFYSVFGGMSSCIIMGKLFVMINSILNNDRLHLINFIYSFGQALTQLLFPFLINYVFGAFCLNCSLLLTGALILHIIPITMLVMKNTIAIQLQRNKDRQRQKQLDELKESRYSDISTIAFDFYGDINIKYPSDVFDMENVKWKNPNHCGDSDSENGSEKSNGDNFLQTLDESRIMNSEGVEIMQIILEEEEEDQNKKIAENNDYIESIYEEINRKYEEQQQKRQNKPNHLKFIHRSIQVRYQSISTRIFREILNPLNRSLKIFKFYPSIILKSCDIFSYLLFITLILPNLALIQYHFNDASQVIYFIGLMAICWMAYALFVLKFNKRLKQNCIHYLHIVGILGKFFGYLFTNQRYSMPGFIFGLILISLGHANSFHLQEIMIRNEFHPRKWFYVRGSIYSFSGFLIIVYSIVFHILYINLSLVSFLNVFVLFNLSGLIFWILTHYKTIIYILGRY